MASGQVASEQVDKWTSRVLATCNLQLITTFLFIGYLFFAYTFPLLPNFDIAPTVDGRFFEPSVWGGVKYVLILCWLFGFYALAQKQVRQLTVPPKLWQLAMVTAVFAIPLLLTYPLNANDIYRYFIRGRISTVYGENSFTTGPADFPDDPYLPYAGEWAEETTPYGPVWEMAAWGITATLTRSSVNASPHNLLASLISFKAFALLLHIAIGWLIARSRTVKSPALAFLLWAWNPALLLIFVMDGHNDALMIFWLVLGYFVMQRGKPTVGFIIMMLAPLTKIIGLLPLPFFFISILLAMETNRHRLRFLLTSSVAGLGLILITFLPFGSPLDLLWRLLREASNGAGFSPMTLFVMLARAGGWPLSLTVLSKAGLIALTLAALWLLWWGINGRSPLRGAADVLWAYLAQALNFRLWYAAWPFPFLVLGMDDGKNGRLRLHFGLWFLFTSQLSVFIYGHFRAYLLGGDQLWAHIIGVSFTFGLPFVATYLQDGKETINVTSQ